MERKQFNTFVSTTILFRKIIATDQLYYVLHHSRMQAVLATLGKRPFPEVHSLQRSQRPTLRKNHIQINSFKSNNETTIYPNWDTNGQSKYYHSSTSYYILTT